MSRRWIALPAIALGTALIIGPDGLAAISTHWFMFALFALLILGMVGLAGAGLGLYNIFHEDPELAARYGAQHGLDIYRNSPALFGQAAIVGFLVYVWGFAFTLGIGVPGAHGLTMEDAVGRHVGQQVALSAIVSLCCGMLRVTKRVAPLQKGEWFRCLLGAAGGLIYAWLALKLTLLIHHYPMEWLLPDWTEDRQQATYALMVPALVSTVAVLSYRRLVPVVALVSFLGVIVIIYAWASTFEQVWQPVALICLFAAILLMNGLGARVLGKIAPLKFEIPGILNAAGESHYAPGKALDLEEYYRVAGSRTQAATERGDALDQQFSPGAAKTKLDALEGWRRGAGRLGASAHVGHGALKKIAPVDALSAWRERVGPRRLSPPSRPDGEPDPDFDIEAISDAIRSTRGTERSEKPKLVLVATSGGAYRASFWTGVVLDRLLRLDGMGVLPGFSQNIRLITGASGGMVGGAYLVALSRSDGGPERSIVRAIEDDLLAVQDAGSGVAPGYPYKTSYPIPRDSLSPVAQQLVQRDVPGLFWPGVQRIDRGTVLEDQWESLNVPFADWYAGEAEGWRPSIVFSPMLVETGQPLLIGNLDMDGIRHDDLAETVEFFDWFPASHTSFRVKTAVRLNAAFPYVAPSSALPTTPYRRVVDAGYYDNYGIDLAVAYLSEPRIRDWVRENTSGVIVVQLRAFPFSAPSTGQPNALARGIQWLTTPLEGAASARNSTMTFRNRQSLRQLCLTYRALTGSADFVTTVSFEVDSDASLNWYLPGRELDAIELGFRHSLNQSALAELVEAWWR